MAYSGSGTQADPFVVSTYTDLIAASEAVPAGGFPTYIKVATDINCADDPNYTGKHLSPLQIRGTLYADSMKTIEGLTIESTSFFYFSGSNDLTINNIYFKNCIYKSTSNNGLSVTDNLLRCTNCKFSMILILGASVTSAFNRIYFTDCAGYFKVANKASYANVFSVVNGTGSIQPINTIIDSNIIIDGMNMELCGNGLMAGANSSGALFQIKSISSSIIFKGCKINNNGITHLYGTFNSGGNFDTMFFDGSYFAFLGCSYVTSPTEISGAYNGNNSPFCILCTDDTSITLDDTISKGVHVCLASQVKDLNYLLSIGFLP